MISMEIIISVGLGYPLWFEFLLKKLSVHDLPV